MHRSQHLLMSIAVVLAIELATGLAHAQSQLPHPYSRLGPCVPKMAARLFQSRPGLRVLITRFVGQPGPSEKFAADLGPAIQEALPKYVERTIGHDAPRLGVRPEDVQIAYVPCLVNRHEDARRIGSAWLADVVIWGSGRARSNSAESALKQLLRSITRLPAGSHIQIGTGNQIHAARGAQVQSGILIQAGATPSVTFSTSLTAVKSPALAQANPQKTESSLGDLKLDFPALVPDAPLGLFDLLLGCMAYYRQRYQLALALFMRGADVQYRGARVGMEFLVPIGSAQLWTGHPKEALVTFGQALESCALGDARCQAWVLRNIGSAHERLGDRSNARASYDKALEHARHLQDLSEEAELLQDLTDLEPDRAKQLTLLEQALALARKAGDLSTEAHVVSALGSFYSKRGDHPKALEYHEQVLALRRKTGELSWQVLALSSLGLELFWMGETARAFAQYEEALALCRRAGEGTWERGVLTGLALVLGNRGEKQRALFHLEQALQVARRTGDRRAEAQSLIDLGMMLNSFGGAKEALARFEQARDLARESSNGHEEAMALNGMASSYAGSGDFPVALKLAKESLELFQRQGEGLGEMMILGEIAFLYSKLEDTERAIRTRKEVLALAQEAGNTQFENLSLMGLAAAFHGQGDYEKARPFAEQSLALARKNNDVHSETATLLLVGAIHYCLGTHGEALAHLQAARQRSERTGDVRDQTTSLMLIGMAFAALSDHSQAVTHLVKALALMKQWGGTQIEGQALANLGDSLVALGRPSEAVTRYREAVAAHGRVMPPDLAAVAGAGWRGLRLALRERLWPQANELLKEIGLSELPEPELTTLRAGLLDPRHDDQRRVATFQTLGRMTSHLTGDAKSIFGGLSQAGIARPRYHKIWGCPGTVVSDVRPESPAARVGLKLGDIVLRYQGRCIKRSAELRPAMESTTGQPQVTLEVFRGERQEHLNVSGGRIGFVVEEF